MVPKAVEGICKLLWYSRMGSGVQGSALVGGQSSFIWEGDFKLRLQWWGGASLLGIQEVSLPGKGKDSHKALDCLGD